MNRRDDKLLFGDASRRRRLPALATVKFTFADFNLPVLHIAGFVSVQDSVTLQVQVVARQV